MARTALLGGVLLILTVWPVAPPACAEEPTGEWRTQLRLLCIQVYAEKKDYQHALADLEQWIEHLKPNDAPTYRLRASLRVLQARFLKQRLLDDPTLLVKEVTSSLPASYNATSRPNENIPFGKSQAAFAQALEDYASALSLNPADAETYRSRADAYFDEEDYEKGLADLSAVIRLRPRDAQAYRDRAAAYCQRAAATRFLGSDPKPQRRDAYREDYRRAVADCTAALRLAPRDAALYALRGEVQLSLAAHDEALADATEALRLRPGDKDACAICARVYGWRKDYDRAITACTELMRLYPRAPEYPNWLGERAALHEAKGDIPHALADHTEVIRLEPDDPIPVMLRAEFLQRHGDYDGALADFHEAIRLGENNPYHSTYVARLYTCCARLHVCQGDLDGALADCTQAIRHHPNEGDLYFWRAVVRAGRGDYDGALSDCRQASDNYPHKTCPRALQTALHLFRGEYGQALADIRWGSTSSSNASGTGEMSSMGGYDVTPLPLPRSHSSPPPAPIMPPTLQVPPLWPPLPNNPYSASRPDAKDPPRR